MGEKSGFVPIKRESPSGIEENLPCNNYRLDLTAAFGTMCVCGVPRSSHGPKAFAAKAQQAAKTHTATAAAEEHLEVEVKPAAAPKEDFSEPERLPDAVVMLEDEQLKEMQAVGGSSSAANDTNDNGNGNGNGNGSKSSRSSTRTSTPTMMTDRSRSSSVSSVRSSGVSSTASSSGASSVTPSSMKEQWAAFYDLTCMTRDKAALSFRDLCEELSESPEARRLLRLPSAICEEEKGEAVLRKIFAFKPNRSADDTLPRKVFLSSLRSRERRRLKALGLR